MVTLLWTAGAGGNHRCDARCHNAQHPACACCCGGAYHGKGEGTPELRQAVEENQERLLWGAGLAEQKGELRILYARPSLNEAPVYSHKGRVRPAQVRLGL